MVVVELAPPLEAELLADDDEVPLLIPLAVELTATLPALEPAPVVAEPALPLAAVELETLPVGRPELDEAAEMDWGPPAEDDASELSVEPTPELPVAVWLLTR